MPKNNGFLTKRLQADQNPRMWSSIRAIVGALAIVVAVSEARTIGDGGVNYLQSLVDTLGDEILTHPGLRPMNQEVPTGVHELEEEVEDDALNEVDDDVPHPVKLHNWASHLHRLGQISGVAINPNDEPVVFHRGNVEWGPHTFDKNFQLVDRTPIPNVTICTLDPETGEAKNSWGSNMFYVPHGLAVDLAGNTYVTDVGLHQVMRFPPNADKPDLVLGEAFVPGSDEKHFCQPTSLAVSEATGTFFVADGYCNSRILKYNKDGKLLKIIKGEWNVAHSLALFEEEDVLCVSDRENAKIDCMKAGLRWPVEGPADRDETGVAVITYTGVGRTYAIAAKGTALLSVSGSPMPRGITIDTASQTPRVLDSWGERELKNPHDIAISLTGDAIYVADVAEAGTGGRGNKIHKFEVIRSPSFF